MRGRIVGSRRALGLAVTVIALSAPQGAQAAIDSVFGGSVDCRTQADGVRFCGNFGVDARSTVRAYDGVPIDVDAAFPPAPASGADGNYPLVMIFHGYGGEKIRLDGMRRWLDQGYATFSMTDRGFQESCGSPASQVAAAGACANGFVRLIDNRFEVRDAQEFAGALADEGLIDPQRVGATGSSYGGGMSMALAALRDRKVLPDGSLVPWTSPAGKPMRIAAAAPTITWSDLAYSLTPNGSTLDYVADAPYRGRIGVVKESLVNGLYFSGLAAPGFYAPPNTAPSADLTAWRLRLLRGEPYDGDPSAQGILDEITANHSSYYIDHSQPPAPLLLANGFTDDLFPVDEMVRYYNRTRTEYPDADIALVVGEILGHPRSQTKPAVLEALRARQDAWFAHFLRGDGPAPQQGVEAFTETCPGDATPGGPYTAANWARINRGEIRLEQNDSSTIEPGAGSDEIAATFNPVGGTACGRADGADLPGVATYRLEPAPPPGFTLIGSATVIADFELRGETSQVAARLLDVAPDGQETLVARGLWRPANGGPTRQVFQLHPNGWTVAEGHVAKLELLPADTNPGPLGGYGRRSDGQQQVTVTNVDLRLPVVERPGALGGLVKAAAPKLVPDGYALAADFAALGDPRAKLAKGKLKVKKRKLRVRVKCPPQFEACTDGRIVIRAKNKGKFKVAKGRFEAAGGKRETLKLKLRGKARRYFARHRRLAVRATVTSAETLGPKRATRNAVGKRRRR